MPIKDIQVRKLAVRPGKSTPKYWFAEDVFLTHFFNAISSTFPEGERFFIRSVRYYADQVKDPQLIRQIAGFLGQEGQHSKEHDGHIQLLLDQGYTILQSLNRNQRLISDAFNRYMPKFALALTTAVEHVTAIFAHQILAHPDHWIEPMHPSMRPLWRWHAIEEAEHKAVAFDVYQLAVGSNPLRRLAMVQVTCGFLVEVFIRHCLLLGKDRALRPKVLWHGCKALFGRNGYLRVLAPKLGVYYRSDFHPWQQDNTQTLTQRRQQWGFQTD